MLCFAGNNGDNAMRRPGRTMMSVAFPGFAAAIPLAFNCICFYACFMVDSWLYFNREQ